LLSSLLNKGTEWPNSSASGDADDGSGLWCEGKMEGDVRGTNGNVDEVVGAEVGKIVGCHSDVTSLAGE
jgi:hypothetical protein